MQTAATRDYNSVVSVIISDPRAAELLSAAGLQGQQVGEHWLVRAPLQQIADHANAFERVALAPALRPLLDKSRVEIGAKDVHDGTGVRSRTGEGVLVGVLDTGIDLYHPAFFDADGHSRVLAAWDQDAAGVGPNGYGFGKVCTHDDIEKKHCAIDDTIGHGTHVAGIMAGALAPHIGIAKDAQIVVVKSSQFTDVAAAVDWMFRVAKEAGKPMVINLSLGGHLGAHDGQSELEQVLAKLQGPGHIIVTAAGNDGATPLHARLPASKDEKRVELVMPSGGLPNDVYVEMWQTKNHPMQLAIEITTNDGALLARHALEDFSGAGVSDTITVDGVSHGNYAFSSEYVKQHGKIHHLLVADRKDLDPGVDEERWYLVSRGDDAIDAWLTGSNYDFANPLFATEDPINMPGWVAGDTTSTLTIPGTAKDVITVGSYVTKNEWESQKGRTFTLTNTEIHTLSTFSSAGPTANPTLTGDKPDLVAPGQLIAGPRSSSARALSSALAIDDNFAIMQGTSMSAPHVAGAVALLLQARPALTPAEVKKYLKDTAVLKNPDDAGRFGAGVLDVKAAMIQVDGSRPKGCQAGASDDAALAAVATVLVLMRARLRRRSN